MRKYLVAVLASLLLALPTFADDAAPDSSAVEAAHAAWSAKANKKTRKALDEALDAYDGPPTTATVLAHLARVKADGANGRASALRSSAQAAANHLEHAKDQLPQQYLELRYMAAASLFNHRQKPEAIKEMAHVQGEAYLYKESSERDDAAFRDLHNNSRAWIMAMEAFFDTRGKARPKSQDIEAILASYGADTETINAKAREGETLDPDTGEQRLPFCKGGLEMTPRLKYPKSALYKGMVGAVIFEFDQDETGAIINPRVIASVPDEGFKEKALKTVKRWSYKADENETPGETCRLDRTSLQLPVVFEID